MTRCKKPAFTIWKHSVVEEETEVQTLGKRVKTQWDGVPSRTFCRTVFSPDYCPFVILLFWDRRELKELSFFLPIQKCIKWHALSLQESAFSLGKTKFWQHEDPAKKVSQFCVSPARTCFFHQLDHRETSAVLAKSPSACWNTHIRTTINSEWNQSVWERSQINRKNISMGCSVSELL